MPLKSINQSINQWVCSSGYLNQKLRPKMLLIYRLSHSFIPIHHSCHYFSTLLNKLLRLCFLLFSHDNFYRVKNNRKPRLSVASEIEKNKTKTKTKKNNNQKPKTNNKNKNANKKHLKYLTVFKPGKYFIIKWVWNWGKPLVVIDFSCSCLDKSVGSRKTGPVSKSFR